MHVKDCMSTHVAWIEPHVTLKDAAILMRDRDVGSLPIGDNDRLVGMVTDRDIVIRGAAQGMDPASTPVSAVMSDHIRYCRTNDSLKDVAANMAEIKMRRLPVVDDDKRLVGMISLGDIARFAQESTSGEALREIVERV